MALVSPIYCYSSNSLLQEIGYSLYKNRYLLNGFKKISFTKSVISLFASLWQPYCFRMHVSIQREQESAYSSPSISMLFQVGLYFSPLRSVIEATFILFLEGMVFRTFFLFFFRWLIFVSAECLWLEFPNNLLITLCSCRHTLYRTNAKLTSLPFQ